MSRTKLSIINLTVAMTGQVIGIIISFIARIYFIKILGAEYLGINGLFTNLLAMISLVELGIGPAIVFSLYKPLAESDVQKVKALMFLYKRVYVIIGSIIFVIGLSITPFLHFFIKDMPDISNLRLIFVLFIFNSSISYFYSYKRNLIIADQNRYIATIYRYSFFSVLNILQIIFLIFTKSYIIFLILQIIFTFLENITVAKHADKMYPFLQEKKIEKLDSLTAREIKNNTIAMMLHKIGGIVVNSTDNILISVKVGLSWVGLYSNYQLIINALNTIIGQVFSSITASVGNLGAKESKEKSYDIFKVVLFVNFWIYGFTSICLYYLFNPFIELWLGEDLVMNTQVVAILVINYYFQGMRKSVLTFSDAFGLYWYSRYKPLFESIINIAISLYLAPIYGIVGIFIGTLVSTLTTCFWVEPYILYKYGFNKRSYLYFKKYFIYIIILLIVWYITGRFSLFIATGIFSSFIGRAIICFLIPNMIFLLLFYQSKEFKYLWSIFKSARFIKRSNNN